jgi:hypothetical protein
MKAISTFLMVCLFFFCSFAQTTLEDTSAYYWYKDQKIFLIENTSKKFLLLESVESLSSLEQSFGSSEFTALTPQVEDIGGSISVYHSKPETNAIWTIVESGTMLQESFTENQAVKYEAPFYYTTDSVEVGLSHLFYVKLFNSEDIDTLEYLATLHNIEILGNNRFMPLWFTLACSKNSSGNSLEMANLFYETGLFAAGSPDRMVEIILGCSPNDDHFPEQWNLVNDGQHGGTIGRKRH